MSGGGEKRSRKVRSTEEHAPLQLHILVVACPRDEAIRLVFPPRARTGDVNHTLDAHGALANSLDQPLHESHDDWVAVFHHCNICSHKHSGGVFTCWHDTALRSIIRAIENLSSIFPL